jgi:hypothetical protein
MEHTMAKVPPQMWEKPEAFDEVAAEDDRHEGVIDDIVGHNRGQGSRQPPAWTRFAAIDAEEHGDHIDFMHDGEASLRARRSLGTAHA